MNVTQYRIFFLPSGLFLLVLAACSVVIEPNPGNGNGGSQEPPPEFVTIRFINASSDQAVQVEFYATNEPLEAIPDELFADDTYLVNQSIGVAGSGLLEPQSGDEIDFECTETLTIGTLGGEFRDNETGEVLGRGNEVYKAPGGFSLCGGTAVFTYSSAGDEYVTRFAFE
jgi:hypothetical protein